MDRDPGRPLVAPVSVRRRAGRVLRGEDPAAAGEPLLRLPHANGDGRASVGFARAFRARRELVVGARDAYAGGDAHARQDRSRARIPRCCI